MSCARLIGEVREGRKQGMEQGLVQGTIALIEDDLEEGKETA